MISGLKTIFTESNLKPEQFIKEPSPWRAASTIDGSLQSAIPDYENGFKGVFWSMINREINIDQCEIYSLEPEGELGDPFSQEGEGSM